MDGEDSSVIVGDDCFVNIVTAMDIVIIITMDIVIIIIIIMINNINIDYLSFLCLSFQISNNPH